MAKNPSLDAMIGYIVQPDPDTPPLSWGTMDLTVDLSGLSAEPDMLASARLALDAWTTAAGFHFTEVASGADIKFDTNSAGAYTDYRYNLPEGSLFTATVHVAEDWMFGFPADEQWGVGDYGMQTFIHEIGHALGLHHPGVYNGVADYDRDAIFEKDTVQFSVMSYFDQSYFGDASVINLATPAIADIAAIEDLYGPLSANLGNTKYGAGGVFDFSDFAAFTISDSGGTDTIDLRGLGFGARLDLRPGAFSDIGQRIDGLAISIGTVIERASGTGFGDRILGNAAANRLLGLGGADTITGGNGADTLQGGAGADKLTGGAGADVFLYAKTSEIAGDLILDFTRNSDMINLSAIDADTTTPNKNEAFDFIGTGLFSETAGELRYVFKKSDTYLAGDTDGDGKANFTLHLDHKIALSDNDIIL